MKRKLAIGMLSALLLQMPAMVLAAEVSNKESDISSVSACYMENTLYSFIHTDCDAEQLTAQTELIGGITTKPLPVAESGCKMIYVFLIDNSGSMKKYASEVKSFAEALIEKESQGMEFRIITFGEQVLFNKAVDTEKCLDKAAVKKVVLNAIDSLDYGEDWTDTYMGVTSVMDYLDKAYPGDRGDMVNLILLTDGEPDLEDKSLEDVHAKAAVERIDATPEIVLHTVSFQEWNPAHVRPQGTGMNIIVENETGAVIAAADIVDFVDGLYRLDFPIGSRAAERFSFEYYLSGMSREADDVVEVRPITVENIPVMMAGENGWIDPATIKPDREKDEIKMLPFMREEGDENIKLEEEEIEAEPIVRAGAVKMNTTAMVVVCIGIVFVIISILLMIKLLGKRKNRQKEKQGGAVPIRFDIISGCCASTGKIFYLSSQLLIGSDSRCDFVLAEPGVSPQNSRVFLRGQEIYIEDLDSLNGTSLGGMRIHAPNRLRSGDKVSIGTVCFQIYF